MGKKHIYETEESTANVIVKPNIGAFEADKTADKKEVKPGDKITYTIKARNTVEGNSIINNVVIEDILPKGLTLVSAKSDKGTVTISEENKKISLKLDKLLGGEEIVLTIVADVNADASGILKNIAVVRGESPEKPDEPGEPLKPEEDPKVDVPVEPIKPVEPGDPGQPIDPEKPKLNKDDNFAYMQGYPDNTFRPSKDMTRAEATSMFARLTIKQIGLKTDFKNNYNDVSDKDWYSDYIAYMSYYKLVEGYPDGSFRPNNTITRAEFSAIASRFDELTSGESNFTDVSRNHWAKKYIDFAYTKGWIQGYPDGTFKPNMNITREEAVSVVNRMLEKKADKNYILSKLPKNISIEDVNNILHKDYSKEDIVKYIKIYKDLELNRWSFFDIQEASNSHDFYKDKIENEIWTNLRLVK